MRVLHEVTGLHREPSGLQFKDVRVPKFELNWHQHAEWELTYIVSGSGYRMVGGSIEAYFPGDLVLIGSGIPHSWVSSDATDDSARAIVLHASPERMAWFAQLSGAERFFQLTELAHRGIAFEVDDARALERMAAGVATHGLLLHRTVADVFAMLEGLPYRTLNVGPEPPRTSLGRDSAPQRALEIMATHFRDPDFRLHSVLHHLGLSPANFCAQFKRATGTTFTAQLNQLRTTHAARELAATKLPINEIALRAGYGSVPYFNRVFKRAHGTSPHEFRDQRSSGDGRNRRTNR